MTPAPLAITWAGGALLVALVLPRLRPRRRRLAAVLPLAASVVALLTLGGGGDVSALLAPGGLVLGRAAGGMALVSALATTVAMVLSPPADSGDIVVIGGCGALSVLAMATGSPVVWATCFVGAFALLGIRWLAAAPSRSTLAAARVATLGSASLVAAAPFLPVEATTLATRSHLVAALLAVGVAAGIGLLPVGGWVIGSARHLRGASLVPWLTLLVPALLLTVVPAEVELPGDAQSMFAGVILPMATVTAAWSGLNALLVADGERYIRVLVADLALVALGLATQDNGARLGALVLVLTHLFVSPLTLQEPLAAFTRQRRLAWLALSGVPPSPAFWGRFALVTGSVASYGGLPLLLTLPTMGALLAVSLRAIAAARTAGAATRATAGTSRAVRLAAWLAPLAAIALGLVPDGSVRALLGVG
jgi:hypothetical protein